MHIWLEDMKVERGCGVASSQALPNPLPNKNKKGENLEDFDHTCWTWLDMVWNCLTTPENIKCKKILTDLCPP